MIAKIIEYSARNKFIVFLLVFFLAAWGYWAMVRTPPGRHPRPERHAGDHLHRVAGRSPDLVEDQITYPISSTLLAAPKVQVVRGFLLPRQFLHLRHLRRRDGHLLGAEPGPRIPAGGARTRSRPSVNPVLGPDATSLGWGFSYALVDETGKHDLAQLRSLQDWNLKLALESVPGVSQVASVGGFVQAVPDHRRPEPALGLQHPAHEGDGGGPEEQPRRGRPGPGVLRRRVHGPGPGLHQEPQGPREDRRRHGRQRDADLPAGTSRVSSSGPRSGAGLADLDGKGEVAGGIVVVRFGENVLERHRPGQGEDQAEMCSRASPRA